MDENAKPKTETPEAAKPQQPVQAPATTSAATAAASIKPEKRGFKWYTPFGIAKDFVKGTVLGLGNGLSKGAKMGLKIGLIAAAVAFFLPLFPVAAGAVAQALPWLTIGTNAAGVATFIPNGIAAIVAGLGWGLAGAAAGATVAGGLGLATGGAYELKLRGRREKYAEELAERAEMRAQESARRPHSNWRAYANAMRQESDDRLTRMTYFNAENQAERQLMKQQSWTDRVHASRQNNEIWR